VIPSLVAGEVRDAILEYLTTAFALADDDARRALSALLIDRDRGIFRGPYLQARTPYQQVPHAWESTLGWLPDGLTPYVHQAAAFARLSSLGRDPGPVIITTGTGSGKTESFLLPVLDHCRRHLGTPGVKALLLYPMNALASDQARRIARYVHTEPGLRGITAGLYVGGAATYDRMGPDHLITDRNVVRDQPPDILLTNYKMLDYLLLREADARIWETAPQTLRYLVLDEFHTYDGAQGTDVAMLLRRLGATLRVPADGPPLGLVTPVATSATLGGSSMAARQQLREFAERVFGLPFGPESIVGESRVAPDAAVSGEPVPTLTEISELALPIMPLQWQELALLFTGIPDADPAALGAGLRHHPLTTAVAGALRRPLPLDDAAAAVAARVLPWAVEGQRDPAGLRRAVLLYLALLSRARMEDGRPLLHIEVQLWVRELHRVLRAVSSAPEFRWWSDSHDLETPALPAAYCRNCGRSGWSAVAGELTGPLRGDPEEVWRAGVRNRGSLRVLLAASPAEPGVGWLDPETLEVHTGQAAGRLPVLCTPDARAAEREECPSCGRADTTRFLGSRSATLVSVSLTQMFGSAMISQPEQRNLVFTDSVQDAAHRAAFVEGRAFQFNLRSLLARAVPDGGATLADAATALSRGADDAELYAITPPDFSRRLGLVGDWLPGAGRALRQRLARRLEFQAHLEFGLRSRLGRTLELTGTLTAEVMADLPGAAARAREIHANLPERGMGRPPEGAYHVWLLGILDRLRVQGGIQHRWLDAYVQRDGSTRWPIWGGRERGMPAFPRGAAAPSFFTTAERSEGFDSVSPRGEQDTWLTDWTRRCLGLDRREARALLREVIATFAYENDPVVLFTRQLTRSQATVYGLSPSRIMLTQVSDEDLAAARARLHCTVCRNIQPTAPDRFLVRLGGPCPRFRCPGVLEAAPFSPGDFYRRLYRSGLVRRIVARDHTGLLNDETRAELERAFTAVPQGPLDPNVLACTPTLELGIDIGDLPGVTLASIPRSPASYLQRVGRAGRRDGNAFVLAAARARPREQYFFAEPLHLIDGDVRPPGCYLDATELLSRQFTAFCLDRAAAGELAMGTVMPPTMGALVRGGLDEGGWMRRLLDAVAVRHEALADDFLARFGADLAEPSRAHIRSFAAGGMRAAVAAAFADWTRRYDEITTRLVQLQEVITVLQRRGQSLEEAERDDLRRLRGELKAQRAAAAELEYSDSLGGLVGLGLLPNYTLLDDATTLDVSLWWVNEEEGGEQYSTSEFSYQRGTMTALTELAPGAVFYAAGQRIRVDALDLGPRDAPLWREWRLCPLCGWGVPSQEAAVSACPRCGTTTIRDAGAVHKMLELRRVSSVQSLDDAVIEDDAEEREEVLFRTVGSVDAEPEDIERAWRLRDAPFGAEYLRSARVRRVNLGPASRPGPLISIAGHHDVPAPGFRTCTHCGVVDGVQDGPRGGTRHRGWCATRRGGAEQWEQLLLHHDLRTQAVRLLLPVSLLDVESRMASLTGAIMLGLREDFGGEPQHLDRLTIVQPGRDGTRRYLVLHDVVPGGTGYLDRIGDPARMHIILEHAQRVLRDCPCAADGLDACHRCLLGVVSPAETALVRRTTALAMVTEILSHWDVTVTDTITRTDMSRLVGSELEQRFRALLASWAGSRALTYGDEMRLSLAAGVAWRMRSQVPVGAACPDYLFTSTTGTGPDVAVFLDGFTYHATPEHNRAAEDAAQRAALREAGYVVWTLTWADLDGFERYLSRQHDEFRLLSRPVENMIRQFPGAANGAEAAFGNPMRFLVSYLSAPGSEAWESVALATANLVFLPAAFQPHGPSARLGRDAAMAALIALHRGESPASAGDGASPFMIGSRVSEHGCRLAAVADAADSARRNSTVSVLAVLDDRPESVAERAFSQRWQDWLHWANVLQFLRGDQRTVHFVTITSGWTPESVLPAPGSAEAASPPGRAAGSSPLPEPWATFRDLTDSPAVLALIERLADSVLVKVPELGLDVGDDNAWNVELAWAEDKIAVVIDVNEARDAWLREQGWHLVPAADDDVFDQIMSLLAGGQR
jgi:ATP-dependent helicase YprA (DUF1998 family)